MEIHELIQPEWIRLDMTAKSREEVIRELAGLLERDGVLQDRDRYLSAVMDRERQGSTAIGFEVAIPHGKSEGVDRPGVAFGRLSRAIRWTPEEEEEARLVFLIAVPKEQEGNEHLQILAALSRRLMHESFREKLKNVASPVEVLEALKS